MSYRSKIAPASLREATEPLFHYTSAEGLLGIIEKRALWASEAMSLNDRAEVRLGWKVITDWCDAQSKSEETGFIRRLAEHPLREAHQVYVLSTSRQPDDANQWRLYAQNATGYAVELDPKVPLDALTSDPGHPATSKTKPARNRIRFAKAIDVAQVSPWYNVLYHDAQVHQALSELAKSLEVPFRQISEEDSALANIDGENLQEDTYEILATIAHLVKSSGFAGENEARKVVTFRGDARHVRYRAGRNGVIGYACLVRASGTIESGSVVRVPPEDLRPLPVRSIRLGPLLPPEHVNSVQRLLRKNGLSDTEVLLSAVPLRP